MKNELRILLLCFILLAGSSCSFLLNDKLVGTWGNVDTQEIWNFKPDGKLEIREDFDPQDPRIIAKGTYRIINSDSVELELIYNLLDGRMESANETVKYEFREDRLYIKPQGKEYVLKKFESPSSVKTIKETKTDAEIVKYRLEKLIEYCSQGDVRTARRYFVSESVAICADLQHRVQNSSPPKVSDKPEKCVSVSGNECIAYRVSFKDGDELYEFVKYNDEWTLKEITLLDTKKLP